LYLAVEVIDESYIERHFGSVNGNLYKPEAMEIGGDRGEERGGQQMAAQCNAVYEGRREQMQNAPERNRGKMKPGENKCQINLECGKCRVESKENRCRQTGKRGDIK